MTCQTKNDHFVDTAMLGPFPEPAGGAGMSLIRYPMYGYWPHKLQCGAITALQSLRLIDLLRPAWEHIPCTIWAGCWRQGAEAWQAA